VAELAGRAEDLFLGFVTPALRRRPTEVLIVPGPLHAMPWAALPALEATPFTVSPTTSLWLKARQQGNLRRADPVRTLVVAGPGLANAEIEAATVGGVYEDPVILTGSSATVANVLSRLSETEIAHVACHGSFRADNPQFSSLRLADGPLNAYDLSSVRHYHHLCVLSACDIGLADANGAGALGMAASLLTGGASAVLASVLPADDLHTPTMMAAFHRRFATGTPAAIALTEARAALDDPLLASGFTLYGSSVRIEPGAQQRTRTRAAPRPSVRAGEELLK
jgi:CHAT domain-containing protein